MEAAAASTEREGPTRGVDCTLARGEQNEPRGTSRVPSVSIDVNVLNSYHRALASGPKGLPALGLRADRTRGDPNLHEEALLVWENGGHVASAIRARGPEAGTLRLATSCVHFPLCGPCTMARGSAHRGAATDRPLGGDDAWAASAALAELSGLGILPSSPTTSSSTLASEALLRC